MTDHVPTRYRSQILCAPTEVSAGIPAFQSAPTLLAGSTAGSHGEVRVWRPSRYRLWTPVAFWSLLTGFAWHSGLPIALLGLPGFLAAFALLSLMRPCCIAMDGAGMGVSSFGRSTALRWDEIVSLENTVSFRRKFPNVLVRTRGGRIILDLRGFRLTDRGIIVAVIAHRAHLSRLREERSLRSPIVRRDELTEGHLTGPNASAQRSKADGSGGFGDRTRMNA